MGLHFQYEGWQPPALQLNGCYLLAIMAIPQLYHHTFESPDSYLLSVAALVKYGEVNQDYSITAETAPYVIMGLVSNAIGKPGYAGAEVGQITATGAEYWPSVKHPKHNYAIRFGRLANGTEHKVLCDWQLREIYNPAPGDEIVATERYLLYYYGTKQEINAIYE